MLRSGLIYLNSYEYLIYIFHNCISCIDRIAKEQELLEQLDAIKHTYWEKDQLISKMKQEMQSKQEEMMSLSDQFEQREKEILEQKGKQNQCTH